MTEINREILSANYWEHFKVAKEYALIYPINHTKRVSIEKSLDELQKQLNENKN